MKILKSFEKAKEVSYFGLELQGPLATTHLELEIYYDSDNAMLVAFERKPKNIRTPLDMIWEGKRLCIIAKVDPEELRDGDSLRAVTYNALCRPGRALFIKYPHGEIICVNRGGCSNEVIEKAIKEIQNMQIGAEDSAPYK